MSPARSLRLPSFPITVAAATARAPRSRRRASAPPLGKWTFACLLLSSAVVVAASRAPALTILSSLGRIYAENMNGESFPTVPESDLLGYGAMGAYASGNPLAPAATFTATHMAISVSEVPGPPSIQGSGGLVVIPHPGETIGVFGRFDSFNLVRDTTNGSFQTVALGLLDTSLNNGAAGYLLDFQNGLLRIVVSSLGAVLTGYSQVFLTPTADAAIRAGSPFELELRFDPVAHTAQAALTVGSESFQTATTTGTVFTNMTHIDRAVAVNSSSNNALPVAQIASQLDQFEIYLPEPGLLGMVIAGAAALGTSPRARRPAMRKVGSRS